MTRRSRNIARRLTNKNAKRVKKPDSNSLKIFLNKKTTEKYGFSAKLSVSPKVIDHFVTEETILSNRNRIHRDIIKSAENDEKSIGSVYVFLKHSTISLDLLSLWISGAFDIWWSTHYLVVQVSIRLSDFIMALSSDWSIFGSLYWNKLNEFNSKKSVI